GDVRVDERVGFAELIFDFESEEALVAGVLLDAQGRILCAAFPGAPCTVPAHGPAEWTVEANTVLGATRPGQALAATVILHPPSHLTIGDPLAGVDTTITFRISDTGVDGSEDNIGVLGDGTIFTQKRLATMRSTDDGLTWQNVAPPLNDRVTLDPMLYVDPWRGYVFVDHLYVGCSMLSWSTDSGNTWTTNPAACGRPGNDHQKVASGPNALGLPFPNVYYAYSIPGVWVSRSIDGGLTWTSSPVTGLLPGDRDPNNTGPVFADERGNVYVPYYMCDGDGYIGVGVSHDFGLTWKFVEAARDPGACYDVDPGLWTDTAGNVYLAYHRETGVKYVWSGDAGETWSAPVTVSPPTLKSFVHVDAVAGDEGRLAIVYRATPDTAKGPDTADGWAAWHLYVTFVEGATSATPTIRTAIVNDPADPIQRGPVCTAGVTCYGGSRNLLDFIDIAVGPDGRVYPTFTDGCKDGDCPLPPDSRARRGLVGVQVEGPRLFADKAPWAKS
ncbi:MAG TPA: sialidase family protein, partial [Candidatus Thermoplasmatota archaeon]|nr:sialidase family protein [Candidatus Thermoplasmatota archaeon]